MSHARSVFIIARFVFFLAVLVIAFKAGALWAKLEILDELRRRRRP